MESHNDHATGSGLPDLPVNFEPHMAVRMEVFISCVNTTEEVWLIGRRKEAQRIKINFTISMFKIFF